MNFQLNRRQFLSLSAGLTASVLLPRWAWAADLPRDINITRILGFDLGSRRPKICGRNSRLDVHGDRASDRMVRLFTNAGVEGLGNCRAGAAGLAPLLGRNPFDFFKPDGPAFQSPLGPSTMPLWDLAGRVLKKPVFELLGAHGPQRVPVYDGSIYFTDLLPQYASGWQDRFKEEIDLGFKRGHRAFKVKVGRGAKWMPAAEGYERDKAVLKLIRQHAGPDVVIGVDANNGYDLEFTKRLLTDLPDANLAWLEEMFPEQIEQNLELKAFIARHKLKTLVADGESQQTLEGFRPFMQARALDVCQGDMNHFGIEGIMTEAAMARAFGLLVAPHNWGSLIAFYMQLHLGRAAANFYRAENDPLDTDVLTADGYTIRDGTARVPDAPGFGLKINEARFASAIKPTFDLKF